MDKITTLDTQNPVGLRNAINETLGQFVPAHIVGATFSAAWLAETEGGNPLTPVVGRLYTVVTAGDYKNQLFRWNDATYEQVGRTTIDELAGGALPVTAPETETALSVAVADWVNISYDYLYNGAARGATSRTVLVTGNFSQFRNATNFPANKFYQYVYFYGYQTREVYAEGIQPSYRILVFGSNVSYTNIYIYDDRIEYQNGGDRTDFTFTQIYYDYGSSISKATKYLTNITTHSRVALTIDTADRTVANTADLYDTVDVTDGSIVLTATNLPTAALNFTVENILTSGTYTKGVIKGLIDADLPVTSAAVVSGTLPTTGWSAADDGWQAAILPSSTWQSVTYGNGKFVAVASDTTVAAYSLDGITWSESTMPWRQSWKSVTYGNGKFVAVGGSTVGNTRAAYSLDGITWSESTVPPSSSWQSVTYGNGKFVAVTRGGTVGSDVAAYSLDGITWVENTMPSSSTWQSVTYGNGKFVAISGGDVGRSATAYSLDGITWVASTILSPQRWQSVTYGNDKFVAVVGSTVGSTVAAYSLDGITWFTRFMPSNRNWQSVTYGNDKFVAVASDTTVAAYWIAADLYNYTITDATVKATSDVLLELTDAHAIKAHALEAGKITVQRGTIPLAAIPYTYKVVQTSSTGQFTLVNHFVPTYAEYSVSDYEVTVGDSSSIVYIKLVEAPVRSDRYYAFIKGEVRLKDDGIEDAYFVNGSVDLDEAPTAINTYAISQSSIVPNSRLCLYYPEVPEFRVVTPNLNIATPTTKSQTLKLCVINF